MMKSIYVAATNQHVGKTTSTLGLFSGFHARGYKLGYCKPVGQRFLDIGNDKVDKDALLFSEIMEFDLVSKLHSPVILGQGATEAFLENPQDYKYNDSIRYASKILQNQYQLVIYEGTGHPGVGSIVNLSNAQVAKMVGAPVIIVVEGGIGSTIDRLRMSISIFKEFDVPVLGVIVNKVIYEKMDKIKYFVKKGLDQLGLPLLGVIPYEKSLVHPLMRAVTKAAKGKVVMHGQKLFNRIEDIIAGSSIDIEKVKSMKNLLLVVSSRGLDNAIETIIKVQEENGLERSPLSGIIATGPYQFGEDCLKYIDHNEIPLVKTSLDTYGVVMNINKIEVKINTSTPWKVQRAIQLFEEYVDFNLIEEKLNSYVAG